MPHNHAYEGRRAALRRLRHAQLNEARRLRQAVAAGYTLTPVHLPMPGRRDCGGPPGGDVPDANAPDLAHARAQCCLPHDAHRPPARRPGPCDGHARCVMIAARLASGQQEDAYLRHMACALSALLDRTYENDTRRQAA